MEQLVLKQASNIYDFRCIFLLCIMLCWQSTKAVFGSTFQIASEVGTVCWLLLNKYLDWQIYISVSVHIMQLTDINYELSIEFRSMYGDIVPQERMYKLLAFSILIYCCFNTSFHSEESRASQMFYYFFRKFLRLTIYCYGLTSLLYSYINLKYDLEMK